MYIQIIETCIFFERLRTSSDFYTMYLFLLKCCGKLKKKNSQALALFVIHGHNHLILEGTSLSTHYLAGVLMELTN